MWQEASAKILPRVVAVVGRVTLEIGGREAEASPFPLGSGVVFNDRGVLTNAHVVSDEVGEVREDIHVGPFAMAPNEFIPVSAVNRNVDLDLAVLELAPRVSGEPVTLWEGNPLEMGTPIASIGYPIPEVSQQSVNTGVAKLTRRLSAGFISQSEAPLELDGHKFPVPLYEMNALSYGGNSGAPCFDSDGRVIGINVASRQHEGVPAAYSYVIRSDHILRTLDELGAEYDSLSG